MDAHDIFMKITRNAKFKHKKREVVKTGNTVKTEQIENKIKVEVQTTSQDINPNYSNNAITLLGNITSNEQISKKLKKRKIDTSSRKELRERDLKKLHAIEETNHFRNKLHIKVVGSHVPNPIFSFNQLPITNDLICKLQSYGYKEPTAIQMQAIPVMMDGRQLLACAPTGSGKTVAFLIPVIHALHKQQNSGTGCRALILCPTRELAKQTYAECVRLTDSSQLRIKVVGKVSSKLSTLKPQYECDVLMSTPQRICHLLSLDNNAINMINVQWVVVDEADKLFEEYGDAGARSFRSQLKQILDACTHKERRVAMFSATYTPLVARWCRLESRKGYGKGLVRVMVGERNTAPDLVDQHLVYVGSETGKLVAFRELMRGGLEGLTLTPPALVFVQSKERAQHLFSELIYDGISVDAVHADRTQQQRDNTVRAFREGKVWVLICTELMARGLDFKGVKLVINYDMPQSAVAYVHRVGRAGRAGCPGSALTLYTDADRATPGLLRPIAAAIKRSGCPVANHLLHGQVASSKKRRQLRSSQVGRDQIPSKLQLNRNTLRKRKISNTTNDGNKKDNKIAKKKRKKKT